MPARQPKQTAQKTAKKSATTKGPKVQRKASRSTRVAGGGGGRRPAVKAGWKPVSQSTSRYVMSTFDGATRLLTHKASDDMYTEVSEAFLSARNQVAASLETLRVPPCKHDYKQLSTILANLKDSVYQLEQRKKSLNDMLAKQERDLESLQDQKTRLQDFAKTPAKHHALLLEPMEKELHLNFDSFK